MVDAQTVGVLVTAASVTVAAIYYVLNLRISQKNQELTLKTLEQSTKAQELTLKAQQQNLETRQAQMLMNINELTHSREWLKAVRTVETSLQLREVRDFEKMNDDEDMYLAFYNVCGFWEGLGVLVRENLIDVRLIAELWSGDLMVLWDKFGSGVIKCREAWGFPRYMIETEYLCRRVADYGVEHPELGIKVPNFDMVYRDTQ